MVEFNDDTARFLDDAYNGSDAIHRRNKCLFSLKLSGGETVLDLGCGAGHFTVELSRAVGPKGRVIGIDPAPPMLAAARVRTNGRENIDLREGTATDTGLPNSSVDRVAAIQVFSYLQDLPSALREARRILKFDGLLVVSDIHWGGAIWVSQEPVPGQIAVEFWKSQLKTPDVPQYLPAMAADAGFSHCHLVPVPVIDTTLRPDGLAQMLMTVIEKGAAQTGNPDLISDISDWKQEQIHRAQSGRFFFSVTNFIAVLS